MSENTELENSNDTPPVVTETPPVEVVPEQPVPSGPVDAGYGYPQEEGGEPEHVHQPLSESAHAHVQSETPGNGFPTSPPEQTDLPTVDGVREVDPDFETDDEKETPEFEAPSDAPVEAETNDDTPEEKA